MTSMVASKFNFGFGVYILALGLIGMSKPSFVCWVVDSINSSALSYLKLNRMPTSGIDSEFCIMFFLLVSIIGLYYVLCSIIGIFMSDTKQIFAMSSVVIRVVLCAFVLKLVYMDHRISSGFLLFVFQDGITALGTAYLIIIDKRGSKHKTE